MRRPMVIGNWKMHGSQRSAEALAASVASGIAPLSRIDIGLCPAFVLLPIVATAITGSTAILGAQTCSEYSSGAYTGEVSTAMLRELGCRMVLLGHSERRHSFGESAGAITAKMLRARQEGLQPILCLGETLASRRDGATENVLAAQLAPVFAQENAGDLLAASVIAYEPVWAIGTGETASPAQAQAVHEYVRGLVAKISPAVASELRILYGGSVKRANAHDLFAMPDIDGGLIGGASLDAQEFLDICAAAEQRVTAQTP